MYDIPEDPKTIRTRIRSAERALRQEQKRFGFIRDGAGKRYTLGPLYVLLGDTEGALRSFAWFAETFSDDSGEPAHLLCWTLALYRAGEMEQAAAKLCQAMLSNLYLIPRLLGRDQEVIAYGQKTRNHLDRRVCDPAIAQTSACMLPTLSRILDAK